MERIRIKTTARLAFCLIDLNGERGRVDGCVGLSLNEPSLEIIATMQNNRPGLEISSTDCMVNEKMILDTFNSISKYYKNVKGIKIDILKAFSEHLGLGSGTQMRLSIAAALNALNNSQNDNITLAKQVARGGTSGIGVWSFKVGGLIIDGGHSFGVDGEKNSFIPSSISACSPPALIGRYDFPSAWKILCVSPIVKKRLFGESEIQLFKKSCPVDRGEVDSICWTILMRLLPAVAEENIFEYNRSIEEIQSIGFKRNVWQGQQPEVKLAKEIMLSAGVRGIGLSSLGSTLFATLPNGEDEYLIDELSHLFLQSGIEANIWSTTGRNIGADISPCR